MGPHQNLKLLLFSRPCQGNEKAKQSLEKILQSICCCSVVRLCDPQTAAHQASPSFTTSQSLFKLMSIELMMPSSHLIFCCPLLLLLSIFPKIGVFFNELALHIRWPKDYNFSISHPMNIQGWFPLGLTGLISLLSKALSWIFSSTTV